MTSNLWKEFQRQCIARETSAAVSTQCEVAPSAERPAAPIKEDSISRLQADLAKRTAILPSVDEPISASTTTNQIPSTAPRKEDSVPAAVDDAASHSPSGNPQPRTTPPKPLAKPRDVSTQLCSYFNSPGGCKWNDRCSRRHVIDTKAQEARARDVAAFASLQDTMRSTLETIRAEMAAKFDQANRLDVVIVMDCTSSMGAWIASAKDASTTIIRNIQTDHPNAVVRIGFVGYRDYINGNDRIASIPLTTNTADVHAFISQLRARGGCGNFADVPGGLAEALAMRWEADAKVIILVGDAPCHGKEFHDRYNGTMHPSTPCIREQMRTMARAGIDFRFLEIVPANTAKMVAVLQAEYASTLADDGLARSFASVSLSAVGDEVKFGDVVRQISSDSLKASKSRSVIASVQAVTTRESLSLLDKVGEEDDDDGNDDDDENLLESTSAGKDTPVAAQWTPPTTTTPLNWSDVKACPEISAVRHCKYIKRECNDMAKPQTITTSQATTIKFMPTPFAKGTMRTAHGMIDCKLDLRLVAKFYFGTAAAIDYHVRTDVEMTAIARRLAMEFSKSPHAGAGVDFIMTCWYEVKGRPLFTAEPYISGEYHKYNSNGGWVQTAMSDHVATAQAFSHFTYVHTLGRLMVVDLQGVGSIYTDPQLHTLNGNAYGHGNLGVAGMLRFLETHRCNHICRALQLPLCNDSDVSPATTARDDQTMTRSCSLCGTIYTMLHSAFVAELAAYAELLCATCTLKFQSSMVAKPCVTCKQPKEYSQFWYDMKGLETPKYCKACKGSGPKKRKTPLGPHGIVMKAIALAADADGWAPLTKLGTSLKTVDPTFDAKAHASGLLDLLRTFRNIEVREEIGVAGSYSARILKKRPLK